MILKTRIHILLVIILLMSGCTNSQGKQFKELYNDYLDNYFLLVENIDASSAPESIELLHSESNQQIVNELSSILDKMSSDIPKRKMVLYQQIIGWQNELLELNAEKYLDWWGCEVEERRIATSYSQLTKYRLMKKDKYY